MKFHLVAAAVLVFAFGAFAQANAKEEIVQGEGISSTVDQPQCYEIIGCPDRDRITETQVKDFSCENLWLVRNTIFHQRGYCFQTHRGKAAFDNSQCRTSSISALHLSAIERQNVATIQEAERRKSCH